MPYTQHFLINNLETATFQNEYDFEVNKPDVFTILYMENE